MIEFQRDPDTAKLPTKVWSQRLQRDRRIINKSDKWPPSERLASARSDRCLR